MVDPVPVYAADSLTRRVIEDIAAAYRLPMAFIASPSPDAVIVSGPVRLGALLQRIRSKGRQFHKKTKILSLGRFLFDPDETVLIDPDTAEEIVLTEKEAAILNCLAQAEGALISRRDLLTRVWGYVEGVETHTLETHIYRLRKKLEIDPAQPVILLTQEQGYSLKF